ncbi:MAG: CoA transferase [Alphaproteobacteria bacterium]|nr:MAG: CoA transferase [Alphaproteobacteria bacterium]
MPALTGLRVIDLTRILAGPFCTQWLADHGADVIKIEPPQGDDTRSWGPPFDPGTGAASYYMGLNRNKRAVALDLRREEGRAVLLRLLAGADVLVENFKAGTMDKWGLGAEALRARFPRLIQARITGFGADGPLGGLPGYDAVVQAQAGLMAVNGPEGGEPTRMGIPISDICTGMSAAIGILMALHARQATGRGQIVDLTLYDTSLSILFPYAVNFLMGGPEPRPVGNAHPNIAPYQTFPTATVPVFIAGGNDAQFRRLCAVLGLADVAEDPRFATNGARNRHRRELAELIAAATLRHDGEALAARLMAEGVPAGAVMPVSRALDHPHTRHRGMLLDFDGFRVTGNPVVMSDTPHAAAGFPPRPFGADTRAVLAEAGYSAEEIEALIAAGAAFDRPPG